MNDPEATFPIVTEEGFPHGLRCCRCQREIEPGQPFIALLMDDDYIRANIEELCCVYC